MATMTREEREVRAKYPYLSAYGVQQAIRPTDYVITYDDDALIAQERERIITRERERGCEVDMDTVDSALDPANITRDVPARTLAEARQKVKKILAEQPLSCPRIYRREVWEEEPDTLNGYLIPRWGIGEYDLVEDEASR